MVKKVIALTLVLALALFLCSCGDAKSTASDDVPETDTRQEQPAAEQQEVKETETEPEKQEETVSEEKEEDTVQTGIRPEIKEAIDSYETFINSYCEFMESYDSTNLTMLAKYTELMTTYVDVTEKFEAMEDQDLNDEELKYYTEVSLRCSSKLLEVSSNMTSSAGDLMSGMSDLLEAMP
ncbi:MAG: hypothetical protein IKF39_12670 [Oscillospiraceae bacterium]|nr:hypothetical protein [Oscillospiraceae bacterium]